MSTRYAPESVLVEGEVWRIARVWPGAPAPLEAHQGARVSGGHLLPDGTVRLLSPHDDAKLPALGALAQRGRVISHRPGKRAVVRLEYAFAKAVRSGRGGSVADAHRRAAAVLSRGFSVPEIASESGDAIELTAIPGRTLHDLGADPATSAHEWRTAWRAWRAAWVEALQAGEGEGFPLHDAGDEARILREWADRATETIGATGRWSLRDIADRLVRGLERAPASPARFAHRDLHDKQLIWHDERGIGIIDLDTCARADPALDLGNLLAHAELAVAQGRWAPERADIAADEILRAASDLGIDAAAVGAWRRAARFRVACVHLLRPPGRRVAHRELFRMMVEESRDA